MIDYNRKVIILHPPKTGGQALMKALGMPHGRGGEQYFAIWRHDTLEDIWSVVPETRDWPVYLLVRNPFARMVSCYHYVVQTQFRKKTPLIRYIRSFASCEMFLAHADFEVLRAASHNRQNGILRPCADYAKVQGEYQDVTRIYTERLAEEAARHFGLEDVPVINASDHRDWEIYYTPKRKARVVEYMREDFDRFGYLEDE